jgi:hypothetical protein
MSRRPDFVRDEDILRWSNNIEKDPNIPPLVLSSTVLREVCYAGLYLAEELDKLKCPEEIIIRIQFTAGRLCFGRDPWEVSSYLIESYKKDELQFESDPDKELN